MKKLSLILLIFILSQTKLFSFDTLLFKPFAANIFEARVGSIYEIEDEKLRLDIGNSIDLSEFKYSEDKFTLRFGTDFFVDTRLRSDGRFKFPVETSDYYFGVNSTAKFEQFENPLYLRFRLAHISSHMVDGLSENGIIEPEPFVYSREFIDIAATIDIAGLRPYAGITWVFSTIPDVVNPLVPQLGFDYQAEIINWIDFIAGYDFKLGGYDNVYSGVHSTKLALLLKTFESTGIELCYNYYSGYSMHGMFFKDKDNYNSIGFNVIFY